jgi:hypothetical protein
VFAIKNQWCHFFYALDGVLTSVEIYQKMTTDPQIAHLLTTLAVLNKSPLTHMKKVADIITSIHGFLITHTVPSPPAYTEPQEMAVVKLNDPNSSLVNLSITPSHLFDENAFEFNPYID